MFKGKKKGAKKVEVKSETPNEQKVEIKINLRPLVSIEMHEHRINGKLQAPKFRIAIADRDIITLSAREYDELGENKSIRRTNVLFLDRANEIKEHLEQLQVYFS